MKNITAELVGNEQIDRAQFADWAEASRPLTNMDPEVVGHSGILVASNDAITAYATIQSLLFVDNFIPRPGLSDKERVLSLGRFNQLVEQVARQTNNHEVMYTTKDKHYAAMACKRGWQMHEGMIVLRKKVN